MTLARLIVCAALPLALAWPVAAERLPADVRPLHYQLVIKPDFGTATFDGDVTIDVQIDRATNRVVLNAAGLEIHAAEVLLTAGRALRPAISADPAAETVTLTTPTRLAVGTVKLHVQYGGRLREDGRGLSLARAHGRKYASSRPEPTVARRMLPCFDEPAFTASFALVVVAPNRVTAISNGRLLSDAPGPDVGTHTLRFGTTTRMSSYLLALAVGEFACRERAVDGVPVRLCTAPETESLGGFALDAAERAFGEDGRYFTLRYPFRKLDIVAVPGGFIGSFGSAGVILLDEQLLADEGTAPESTRARLAEGISRGVARQWLGGVVTVRWWDDLWLVEGLAEWAGQNVLRGWPDRGAAGRAGLAGMTAAMQAETLGSIPPLRAPADAAIDALVDGWPRSKAAAVFRMLEAWIGPDVFRDGLNAFVRSKAYEAAGAEDFSLQLAAASGQPVDRVLSTFATRPGVPMLTVETACEGDETIVTVDQRRLGDRGDGAGFSGAAWQVPVAIRGVGVEAPMLVSASRLLTEVRQVFRLPGCFPAVIVNAGGHGYFRTLQAPTALSHLIPLARERMTPAERVGFLDDLLALAGAGAERVGDYLRLVQALAADPTPEVAEAIAEGLTSVGLGLPPGPARTRFEAWVSHTFGPAGPAPGWTVPPGEPLERQRRRVAVLDILGRAGRDETVLVTARVLLAAQLAGGPKLDPSLVPVVVRLAAQSGDAALLDRLLALDARETLAHAVDAGFVTRAIESALESPRPAGLLASWLPAALENPAANVAVWSVVTSRWSDARPRLDGPRSVAWVAAAGRFCDGEMREKVGGFLADKETAPRAVVRLSLDRIDACRDWRPRLEREVLEWLER